MEVKQMEKRKTDEASNRDKQGRFAWKRGGLRLAIGLGVALLLALSLWRLDIYASETFLDRTIKSPLPDDYRYEQSTRGVTHSERKATIEAVYYRYLEAKGSPFAHLASTIYEIEEKYHLPHYLLVAIAGAESSWGRNCRFFNPLGWGAGKIPFASWEEAFETVAYKLATLPAYAQWREEKENIALLALTYNPADNPKYWVEKVKTFREEMIEMQFVKEVANGR